MITRQPIGGFVHWGECPMRRKLPEELRNFPEFFSRGIRKTAFGCYCRNAHSFRLMSGNAAANCWRVSSANRAGSSDDARPLRWCPYYGLIKWLTAGDSNFAEGKQQPLENTPPEIPLEPRCNYCGQIIDLRSKTCANCGTPRIPPIIGAPSTSVMAAPVLNARKATLILLAFLIAQFCFAIICGMVFAVAGGVSQASGNLSHHSRLPTSFLAVAVLIGYVGAGFTMIALSTNLIRYALHDRSEVGAAWVLGRWNEIAKGLALGASMSIGFFIIAMIIRPGTNEESVGPLTRLSMTPGLPQILWLMTALFLAPPLEEMLFRGVLYGGYRQSLGQTRSAWLTTTIFAVLHVTEVIHFFPALLAIVAMALLALRMRLRYSAIGPAVAVHFGYNAVIALGVVYAAWIRHHRG